MICLIALVVFGILGIFSAAYRKMAKEALDCVLRRVTLRKCESGLDKRLKAHIIGKVMRKHPRTGAWIFKHFEVLSWLFTILLVASLAYSTYSVYNYVTYGNCNGPQGGFCFLNPETTSCSFITTNATIEGPVQYPTADDDPFLGPENASLTIIEFGCFACPYSQQSVPIIEHIRADFPDVKIVFRDFPIDAHKNSLLAAQAAECANLQGAYWPYWKALFQNQPTLNRNDLQTYAANVGLDTRHFAECLDGNMTQEEVLHDFQDGLRAEVKGTPTFFINTKVIIGPQDYRLFKKIIKEELS